LHKSHKRAHGGEEAHVSPNVSSLKLRNMFGLNLVLAIRTKICRLD